MPKDFENRLRMPFARILDRAPDSLLMTARVVPASHAGPRLRALYPILPAGGAGRQARFLTARSLTMRGMRILGLPPIAVPSMGEGGVPWGGSISYGDDQVAVWLCRDPALSPGLNLMPIRDLPPDTEDAPLLHRLPGLARMTPPERIAVALSARCALAKALAPRIGADLARDCAGVVPAEGAGITLSLRQTLGPDLPEGARFRAEIRVFPGRVLTWVAVPRRARAALLN